MIRSRRLVVAVVAVFGAVAAGCRTPDLPLWKPTEAAANAYRVTVIRGVAYRSDPEADDYRHRLDLYLPEGKTGYPVVLLIHGGAWMIGDNRSCGLYSSVGEFLARQGIGAVLPNYRLSPGVKHPEHIKDVARAFAWTHEHIAGYGGRPDRLFLLGHSAGGHLVSLLATDPEYLRAEGLSPEDVKGVIAISGVYRIPDGKLSVALGGSSPLSFSLDEVGPVRGAGGWSWSRQLGLPGVPLSLNVFGPAFGDDPQTRAAASPVNHVRPGLPPFLLLSAEHDLPTLPGMAEEFQCALSKQGCEARLLTVQDRNHSSIMFQAIEPQDPVGNLVLEFIRRHSSGG